MIARRHVRVLLAVLLVLVPAMVGVLAGSSVESEAAGLPGSQAVRSSGLTLLLEPGSFSLTYNPGPGGTISGTTSQAVEYGGSGTAVTAAPNTGYHFVSWTDGVLTAARTDLAVAGDIAATATFAIDAFTLSYSAGAAARSRGRRRRRSNTAAAARQ